MFPMQGSLPSNQPGRDSTRSGRSCRPALACKADRGRLRPRVPHAPQRKPPSLKLQRTLMPPVSILLNVLWIVFGGLWMAAAWVIAAFIMAITIIGLPWARAAFNIAVYTL